MVAKDSARPPSAPATDRPLNAAERAALLAEAQARRAEWREMHITDYRVRVAVGCFCPWPSQPRLLEVREGKAVALLDTTGRADGALREPWSPYTIEGMFDAVEQSVRSADVVSVRYDPCMGYPTELRGDQKLGRPDDWFRVTVSGLTTPR